MPRTPTEPMRVGHGLEGRIAHLPSPTGQTTRRVRVEEVKQVAREAVDGSGGFLVSGAWLRSSSDERRGAYCQSMLGSRVVQVEIGS